MSMDAPMLARTNLLSIVQFGGISRLCREIGAICRRLGTLWALAVHRAATSMGRSESEGDVSMQSPYSDDELNAIVLRYRDMIYRLFVVRMKDTYAADDLFQEVFLRLVRAQRRFDSEEHLKAWLLRVAINLCNDSHRSAWSRRTVLYDDRVKPGWEEDAEGEDSEAADEPAVLFEADAPEDPLRSATLAAVQALKPKLREVVHLFYYEKLSIREIADVLGIGESAVKTRLCRARDNLRGQLGEIYHG